MSDWTCQQAQSEVGKFEIMVEACQRSFDVRLKATLPVFGIASFLREKLPGKEERKFFETLITFFLSAIYIHHFWFLRGFV